MKLKVLQFKSCKSFIIKKTLDLKKNVTFYSEDGIFVG